MKKSLLLIIALVLTISVFCQTWSVDKAHSKLGFSVLHLLVSDVEGSFKSFDGKITAPKPDFSGAVFELTADVNSINTDNIQRDAHLKGPDFFDADKYPTITFKSTSFKKTVDKKYKLTGNLTMHGVTKAVEMDVIFNGTTVHPFTKKTIAGFKISGTINGLDFGIGTSTGKALVSDKVTISANGEFIKD